VNAVDDCDRTPLNYVFRGRHPYCKKVNTHIHKRIHALPTTYNTYIYTLIQVNPRGDCACFITCAKVLTQNGGKRSTGPDVASFFQDSESIQFEKKSDGIKRIVWCSIDALIERLTFPHYSDLRSVKVFLLSYRTYITPLQFLNKLRKRSVMY